MTTYIQSLIAAAEKRTTNRVKYSCIFPRNGTHLVLDDDDVFEIVFNSLTDIRHIEDD